MVGRTGKWTDDQDKERYVFNVNMYKNFTKGYNRRKLLSNIGWFIIGLICGAGIMAIVVSVVEC